MSAYEDLAQSQNSGSGPVLGRLRGTCLISATGDHRSSGLGNQQFEGEDFFTLRHATERSFRSE